MDFGLGWARGVGGVGGNDGHAFAIAGITADGRID
jgi:hypothetical protein